MGRQWSAGDRQRFADRNILKALRIPGRRKPAPDADEWDDEYLAAERAAERRTARRIP